MEHRKYKKHNPPHLFIKNAKYFITASTLGRHSYLELDEAKRAVFKYLTKSLEQYNWELEDWVILNNHIHMMVNAPENAETLSDVMNNFHKFTANWLSRNGIKKKEEKYFHNYWDTCISYENSYFARLNYIWMNPVKHGYVDLPENWKFGSYYYRFLNDKETAKEHLEKYPINKLKIRDNF